MVRSRGDLLFNAFVYFLLGIVALCSVLPVMYVVSVSITPISEVLRNGGFIIIPKEVSFAAYKAIFEQTNIVGSFGFTVRLTVFGTLLSLALTLLLAFPLSDKQLPGRNIFIFIIVFTMLFSGGLIPTYLAVKQFGLLNTFWALVLPSAINSFNVLLMKTFLENIPNELLESARIDGARELTILWRLIIPVSVPSMLTIGLFYMVGYWNTFFAAIMYVTDARLHPLQVILRQILMATEEVAVEQVIPSATMQMAAVVFATVPVIIVYPFIQKHFTKGMLLGSVKG